MSAYSKILIVEDEKNTRDGLAQFLESLDFDVITAEDGNAGWKIYEQEKPDLVLSDIKMPGMDGVELLGKIKVANPNAFVILLTAYGSVEDAVQSIKKGAQSAMDTDRTRGYPPRSLFCV